MNTTFVGENYNFKGSGAFHELGIRAILFRDKAKRSFLPDVGLL